jgi:CRISPR system Cascade subunit CasB
MSHVRTERYERFINHLSSLAVPGKEDRAALARLRRCVGKPPEESIDIYPLILPWLPPLYPDEETAVILTGTLFAWHPIAGGKGNLGVTLRRLASRSNGELPPGLRRRFESVLESSIHELPVRLRHLVSLVANNGEPIDWMQLLLDIRQWTHPDRRVQRAWARDFYAGRAISSDAETTSETEETQPQEK